jgi:hypothetical protein
MYEGTKFLVECEENEITSFALHRRGVRQECILFKPVIVYHLYKLYYGIMLHRLEELLFQVCYSQVSSFISNGLQKEIDQIMRYCKE